MDKELLDDFLRRRDHSIETQSSVAQGSEHDSCLRGQHLVERKLGEQVTLISADNESITILMDTQTHCAGAHLPVARPVYKDKNTDAEEYDDYTRWRDSRRRFRLPLQERRDVEAVLHQEVTFNQTLSGDFWSVDAADRRIKK